MVFSRIALELSGQVLKTGHQILLLNFKDREGDASQLNRLIFTTRDAASCVSFFLSRRETRAKALCLQAWRFPGLKSGASTNALSKFYGQAERAISTRKLKPLLTLHSVPIKQMVFLCPSLPLRVGRSNLEEYFTLICIQRLLQPNFATQPCH